MSQLKNITELTKAISGISSNITIGKFVKWVFVLLIFSIVSFYIYNNILDNSAYYSQIERRINIIQSISQLPYTDSIIEHHSLEQLSIILEDLNRQPIISKDLNLKEKLAMPTSNEYVKKLLISSVLPIFIGILLFYSGETDKDSLFGILLVMPVLIFLSSIVPLISNSFTIYSAVIVVLQIGFVVILSYFGNK